jgi:hypothetical protein
LWGNLAEKAAIPRRREPNNETGIPSLHYVHHLPEESSDQAKVGGAKLLTKELLWKIIGKPYGFFL